MYNQDFSDHVSVLWSFSGFAQSLWCVLPCTCMGSIQHSHTLCVASQELWRGVPWYSSFYKSCFSLLDLKLTYLFYTLGLCAHQSSARGPHELLGLFHIELRRSLNSLPSFIWYLWFWFDLPKSRILHFLALKLISHLLDHSTMLFRAFCSLAQSSWHFISEYTFESSVKSKYLICWISHWLLKFCF